MSDLENKKFPIGPFEAPENICDTTLDVYIKVIKDFPGRLKISLNILQMINWILLTEKEDGQ
jgi:hypothetical protein